MDYEEYFLSNYSQVDTDNIIFENDDMGLLITRKEANEEDKKAGAYCRGRDNEKAYLFSIFQKSKQDEEYHLVGFDVSLQSEPDPVVNVDKKIVGMCPLDRLLGSIQEESKPHLFVDGKNQKVWKGSSGGSIGIGRLENFVSPNIFVCDDGYGNDEKKLFKLEEDGTAKDLKIDLKNVIKINDTYFQYDEKQNTNLCKIEKDGLDVVMQFNKRATVKYLDNNLYSVSAVKSDPYLMLINNNQITNIDTDLSNLDSKILLRSYGAIQDLGKEFELIKELSTQKVLEGVMKETTENEAFLKSYIDGRKGRQTANEKYLLRQIINGYDDQSFDVNVQAQKNLEKRTLDSMKGNERIVQLTVNAFDTSRLLDLIEMTVEAPDSAATKRLTEKYRENFGEGFVNSLVNQADQIIKLPYKKMFFHKVFNEGVKNAEANFLDEYTNRLEHLAKEKYKQEDGYDCLREAAKNPRFLKDADSVWKAMFSEPEKYAVSTPKWDYNDFVHEMFADKVEALHQYAVRSETLKGDVESNVDYFSKVGKMLTAIKEFSQDNDCRFNGNLHFDLVNAGIETKKDAKRCLNIWNASNQRPDRYGSPYNGFSIEEIAKFAKSKKMQDWMYPVMMKAVDKGGFDFSEERMPSEKTLFDCCKMWKICPEMPQRLAKQTGKHSLYGRMLAGAIFDKMCQEGKTTPEEWKDNKNLHVKFYEELSRAEKMPRQEALKQYIPNMAVNRKRLTGAGLEERGLENSRENFVSLYREMREKNFFEKALAKPAEARTTLSSRLLVDTARMVKAKGR